MKLIFKGHDYRYAVEQSLLAFFPQERPVYEGEEERSAAVVTLSPGAKYHTAVTHLTVDGQQARGTARADVSRIEDDHERERVLQRIVKLSFFKAARELTGQTPAWGALTGIRPAKLTAGLLESGMTVRQADRVLRDTYFVSPQRRELALQCAQAGLAAAGDLTDRDISLYMGIPFCPTRCAYCSFVSNSVEKSFHLVEPYLEALMAEIDSAAEMVRELGLDACLARLEEKRAIFEQLLAHYNDGRRKTFFNTAVYLLPLEDLQAVMTALNSRPELGGQAAKERALAAVGLLQEAADRRGISLKLNKKLKKG